MITLLAMAVAAACAFLALRRVRFAIETTVLDSAEVMRVLRWKGKGKASSSAEVLDAYEAAAKRIGAPWERDVAAAMRAKGEERIVRMNELLLDLDHNAERWARVPRVCASIASASGFLFASLALRMALSGTDEGIQGRIGEALVSAINAAAFGMAGTSFCIAAQHRAKLIAKAQRESIDELMEKLETP